MSQQGRTYNRGLLGGLAVARAQRLPPHRGGVAAVEDVEGVEGDVGLLAVVGAELGARGEGDGVDDVGALAAAVADDVDGGAPVYKVLGESLFGELKGVALDELLEDAGDLGGVLVGQALVVALALALVAVPGTGVAPTPIALGLPVTGCWCGHGGRDEGRSHGDESCGAHVDGLVKWMDLGVGSW
jgi:hypothetical protein